jgi:hypothetical protein
LEGHPQNDEWISDIRPIPTYTVIAEWLVPCPTFLEDFEVHLPAGVPSSEDTQEVPFGIHDSHSSEILCHHPGEFFGCDVRHQEPGDRWNEVNPGGIAGDSTV